MEPDPQIFEELKGLQWFSKCGAPPDTDFGFETMWVTTWDDAEKAFTAKEWEWVRQEAQGDLTAHLATKFPREDQEWNRLIAEVKPKVEEIVVPIASRFQQEHHLNPVFVQRVRVDVVRFVMERIYQKCRPPRFFEKLFQIYSRGRFPCGWEGEWPTGRLMVI
jgi:hypothetical protein